MQKTAAVRGLVSFFILLLLLPSQTQAADTLSWMTPDTSAHYIVRLRNTPNMPIVAVANWTVLNVTASTITFLEDGGLAMIGSFGVSLISSGRVTLLSARVIMEYDYDLSNRTCLRPCPQLNLAEEHAWEWIPSQTNSSLTGQNYEILQTIFQVEGNETLVPYNRTAWRLAPLVQVYEPYLTFHNFWYDQETGILLRADIFSQGDGNLTFDLANTTPNLAIQNLSVPLTPWQLSLTLLLASLSYLVAATRARHPIKPRPQNPA